MRKLGHGPLGATTEKPPWPLAHTLDSRTRPAIGVMQERQSPQLATQNDIVKVCTNISVMLQEKNVAYGDSALDPVRIFSKAAPTEQLLVRIDDKLSRFARGASYPGDNDIDDLIGYLVLLKIAKERNA